MQYLTVTATILPPARPAIGTINYRQGSVDGMLRSEEMTEVLRRNNKQGAAPKRLKPTIDTGTVGDQPHITHFSNFWWLQRRL